MPANGNAPEAVFHKKPSRHSLAAYPDLFSSQPHLSQIFYYIHIYSIISCFLLIPCQKEDGRVHWDLVLRVLAYCWKTRTDAGTYKALSAHLLKDNENMNGSPDYYKDPKH